jgi:hypothetical protein
MRYFQYPLETLVRNRSTDSQMEFALEARRILRDTDDVLYEALDHGLVIFAANEDALEDPIRVLEEAYPGGVEVRRPAVRFVDGTPVQEPVMYVRVRARREHAGAVLQKLRLRGVRIEEEAFRVRELVVRGEAPLANLIGLPGELVDLTEGTASHLIRLTHYAPVAADPCTADVSGARTSGPSTAPERSVRQGNR